MTIKIKLTLHDVLNSTNTIKSRINLIRHNKLTTELIFKTSFLDDLASVSERLYFLDHKLTKIPKCPCGKTMIYKKYTIGYKCPEWYCKAMVDKKTEKTKKTNLERYGAEHHMQSKEFKSKVDLTIMNKYGVENISQIDSVKKKKEETLLKNFGVSNPSHSKEILDSKKGTYGKRKGIKKERKQKIRPKITRNTLQSGFTRIMNNLYVDKILPNFTIDEYHGVGEKEYKFKCLGCNTELTATLLGDDKPICYVCNPLSVKNNGMSKPHYEIYQFIKSIYDDDILVNNRKIIQPYELDIYLPKLNIAFEINGEYHHREDAKGQFYHKMKFDRSSKIGINLFQFWVHEWEHNSSSIKSFISKKLNLINNEVLKNTTIKEIDYKIALSFISDNHFKKFADALETSYIGLLHNDTILTIMGFTNIGEKNYKIEYYYLNNTDYHHEEELLNYFNNKNNPDRALFSIDNRIATSLVDKINCEKLGSINPSYFLIHINSGSIENLSYLNHKTFDPSLTEYENIKNNGYDRVWDCGQTVWEWRKGE